MHWKLIDSRSAVLMAFNFFWSSRRVMLVAKAKVTWLFSKAEYSTVTSLFSWEMYSWWLNRVIGLSDDGSYSLTSIISTLRRELGGSNAVGTFNFIDHSGWNNNWGGGGISPSTWLPLFWIPEVVMALFSHSRELSTWISLLFFYGGAVVKLLKTLEAALFLWAIKALSTNFLIISSAWLSNGCWLDFEGCAPVSFLQVLTICLFYEVGRSKKPSPNNLSASWSEN